MSVKIGVNDVRHILTSKCNVGLLSLSIDLLTILLTINRLGYKISKK